MRNEEKPLFIIESLHELANQWEIHAPTFLTLRLDILRESTPDFLISFHLSFVHLLFKILAGLVTLVWIVLCFR